MKGQYVRGLVKFIIDIRNLKKDEEKEARIQEEIAKIRVSFSNPKLTDYDKKKNLLKLLYVKMLGYDIELGYLESVQLMASNKLTDKATGYMGCEILLRDYEDVMRLCINTAVEDLFNPSEYVSGLALTFIANSHSFEINEKLSNEVIKLSMTFSPEHIYIRKKMYMCLLRTFKLNRNLFTLTEWFSMVRRILESETNVACLLSICNLLEPILKERPNNWEKSIERLVSFLWEIAKDEVPPEHCYFTIPAPWLTVKILGIFASVPPVPDSDFLPLLSNCFKIIMDKTSNLVLTRFSHKDGNRSKKLVNLSIYMTKTGILRETIRAIVNWFPYLENISAQHISNSIRHLFSSVMSQIRLVALEIIDDVIKIEETFEYIKTDAEFIINFLNDNDPTIKKRSCLILCGLCDYTNWEFIVPELISALRYSEISIQEYMVPLICQTIHKHLPKNDVWVELIFKVILHSPVESSDSISTLLMSTLCKESSKFQEKVVNKCLNYLKNDAVVTEGVLRISAYILGYYGYLSREVEMREQLDLLEKYFVIASGETKGVIVTAIGKFASREESVRRSVQEFLESHVNSWDVNLQTRACEILKLLKTNSTLFVKVMRISPEKSKLLYDREKHTQKEKQARTHSSSDSLNNYKERESHRESWRSKQREPEKSRDSEEFFERDSEERRQESDLDYSRVESKEVTRENKKSEQDPTAGLFSNNQCELLVTSYLRVELQQAYKNQQAKLLVKLTNTSNEVVQLVRCSLHSQAELQGQEHNHLREVTLMPGKAANHKLSFMLLEEVEDLPKYNLEFSADSQSYSFKHSLDLPVSVHKFMSPLTLDPPSFTKLWNKMAPNRPFKLKFGRDVETLANSLGLLNFDVVKSGNNLYVSGSGVKSTESKEFFCLGMFTVERGEVITSYRASTEVLVHCIIKLTKTMVRQL